MFAAIFSAAAVACGMTDSFVCLAERGRDSDYGIVVSAKAAPTERYAAEELSEYIFRQTGVRLPVCEEQTGRHAGNRRAVRIVRDDSHGPDAFRLRTVGADIVVSGGERGVLYGAYELLETYGGVGWFAPDRTVIPKRDAFAVPTGLDASQSPAFELRETLWYSMFRDADFCARLRLNGSNYTPLLQKHGGKPYRFGGGLAQAHTFAKLLPVEKYAKDHPEYFALVGGVRDVKKSAQLCLTNPDVLRIVTDGVLAAIRRDPTARCFGVSQNDNQRYCTCERCAAVDAEEESHAGTMIRFVNAVAAAVEREYPDKVIETLAYQYTRKPPKLTRPRKNVMICLCTIECDFVHPIATGVDKHNVAFRNDANGWKSCADSIYIWDYTTNFRHYPGVFPNFDVLQSNIRFFRDIGARLVFEQGANMGLGGEFEALKSWLLAKWMWNPDLPEEMLLDRFFKGYYGNAAHEVREYFDALRALPRPDGKFRLGCFNDISSQKLVGDKFLLWADKTWQQAENAVRGEDTVVRRNVRMGRFSVDYMRFMRLKDRVMVPPGLNVRLAPPTDDAETLRVLAHRIDALKKDVPDIRLAESEALHKSRLSEVAAARRVDPVGFRSSARIELEEDRFSILGENGWCRFLADSSASGGKALDIFPNDFQWCMQLEMPGGAFDPKAKYRLGVRAKICSAGNAANGHVMEAGIWDRANERAIGAWSVKAGDVRPDEWMQFDLGEFSVDTPQLTVWVSGGMFDKTKHRTNPAFSSLLVDRVDVSIVTNVSVTSVVDVGGVPRFAVDGKPMAATAVMPSPAGKPGEAVGRLREFRNAGVMVSSDVWTMHDKRYNPRQWWLGYGEYDFKLFDEMAMGLVDASPDGFIFPRIKIDPPAKWSAAHPEEMFDKLSPMPESKAWRALCRRMFKDVIEHVEHSPYAANVIGYHIGAFHCGEWIAADWRKPHVRPNVTSVFDVPTCDDDRDPLPPFSRIAARRAAIAQRAEAVADMLIDAASYVKELTEGRKLVGAFFGYATPPHEKISKVLRSGKVDFFAAPPEYNEVREIGHSGRSQSDYQASYRLHGRVFFEESDFRTFLSRPEFSPETGYFRTRRRPLDESVAIIRRSVGKALAGGWENWWFLLGGNDTFSAPEMMESIRIGAEEERRTLGTAKWQPAEVAVFTAADEYATSGATHVWHFRKRCVNDLHERELPTCGVPFDSYELSDIADPRLPEYKVYLFVNAFTLSDAMRAKIKERVRHPGKTAIWVYASGYYGRGEGSVSDVVDMTCVPVVERALDDIQPCRRMFAPIGDAVYARDGWRSVFMPMPPDAAELRKAFREAGTHVWVETGDVFAAGRGYVMVHAVSGGEKMIRLPYKCDVHEIFGASQPREGIVEIVESMKCGETRVFHLLP